MSRKKPTLKLESVITTAFLELAEDYQQARDLDKLRQHWDVIIQKPLSQKTYPDNIENGELCILVPDKSYQVHLKYYDQEMLSNIRVTLKSDQIKKITYKAGILPRLKSKKPGKQNKHLLKPTAEQHAKAEQQTGGIKDLKLRNTASQWLALDRTLQETQSAKQQNAKNEDTGNQNS